MQCLVDLVDLGQLGLALREALAGAFQRQVVGSDCFLKFGYFLLVLGTVLEHARTDIVFVSADAPCQGVLLGDKPCA